MGISTSSTARISENALLRYAIALAAVLTALLMCRGVNAFVAGREVYVLLLPAIAFSAWYCGMGPSVLATGVALVGATYEFMPNGFSVRALTAGELVGVAAFVFSSVV